MYASTARVGSAACETLFFYKDSKNMRKENLAEALRPQFSKKMGEFLSLKSEKAIAAEAEVAKLKSTLEAMADQSPARAGIEAAIESLNTGDDAYERERREEAAFAVIMLCNELRLPVQLKPRKPKAVKSTEGGAPGAAKGKRRRLDKGERERFEKAVVKLLKGGKSLNRTEIIDLTGMDGPMYTAVTRTLKNEGDIVTEGRGRAATLKLS